MKNCPALGLIPGKAQPPAPHAAPVSKGDDNPLPVKSVKVNGLALPLSFTNAPVLASAFGQGPASPAATDATPHWESVELMALTAPARSKKWTSPALLTSTPNRKWVVTLRR